MNIQNHPVMRLFSELLAVPSPPGREERMGRLVCSKLEELDYVPHVDAAGNVTVSVPGKKPDAGSLMMAAHMDEIAMVVTNISEDGRLRVDRSGGLFPYKIGEGPVEILGREDCISGVLSMGSGHRVDASNLSIRWKDVFILTGMSRRQLKDAGVRVGSSVVPARSVRGPVVFGDPKDPLVGAWTFDDRMGVAALIRLLEEIKKKKVIPDRPTLVSFTVHEEGGCQGAKLLARRYMPEVFVAVDGCPIPQDSGLVLDGRPGIWSKDKITNFDQRLIEDFRKAAEQAGTELQVAVYEAAASDASKVYEIGGAARVATIGHIRENSHGYEVARFSVFDNLFKTLLTFIEMWS